MTLVADFEHLSLERLRSRTSEKWSKYAAEVLPAFVAETDFALAPAVRAALLAAIENDDTGYSHPTHLGAAFAGFAARRFGSRVDPDSVFTVPDVMAGFAASVLALARGDGPIIINPPVYPPFFEVIRSLGRRLAEVPLVRNSGGKWQLDMAGMEKAFAAGAAVFLLCHPHNPVGRVWEAGTLAEVAALAKRHDVLMVSDEIHSPLVMPNVTFTPFLSLAERGERCVSLMSASKAWNTPGLKCAVLVAGSDGVKQRLSAYFDENLSALKYRTGLLGIIATEAAFHDKSTWLDQLVDHLDRNRKLLAELLRAHVPKIGYREPEATFLSWLDCNALGLGPEPAKHFLKQGRVAVNRGLEFGAQGAGWVRLNFGTSSAILTEIVERLARAV